MTIWVDHLAALLVSLSSNINVILRESGVALRQWRDKKIKKLATHIQVASTMYVQGWMIASEFGSDIKNGYISIDFFKNLRVVCEWSYRKYLKTMNILHLDLVSCTWYFFWKHRRRYLLVNWVRCYCIFIKIITLNLN